MMQKKFKGEKLTGSMHPAARFAIKYGTIIALLLLMIGCFFPRGTFYAISFCRCAVYSFAVSMIGGLMLDVVASRMGMRN